MEPERVASVSVTPPSASVTVGQATQLAASPMGAAGNPLPGRPITWSSTNQAVAQVDGNGLVSGVAVGGPVMITATSEGQSGSAAITVSPVPVASVTVTPSSATVAAGLTEQLTATPKDAAGDPLSGRTITWVSGDDAVATVSEDGLVAGVTVGGPVTITATSEGQSGTATITVTPAPVATVTVSPPTTSIMLGKTVQLSATPLDAAGHPLIGRTVTWSSGDDAVATVSGTGLVEAMAAGGPVTITATSEGRSGTAMVTVTPLLATGPLRVSPINPRYFTDGSGRAIYLTGSHTWMNFQDAGFTDPPPAFNWTAYLDFLVARKLNVIKLWRWEEAKWSAETPDDLWFDPLPYLRPGPGTALDGKPRFDLTQFNPAYFARMRQRVIEAGQRGIYVAIMLFNGWSIETKGLIGNPWPGHPFHRDNNINGIDGDPDQDVQGIETHTLEVPAIVALQEAYVRRVVDAVNDLDNVLYEISNESPGGAEPWQEHMIVYVKQYEAGKPKQHPVGMTKLHPNGSNIDLFASSADWIAPDSDIQNPSEAQGRKVILSDTDHICGICGNRAWVWKSLTQGVSPMLMDGYDGTFPIVSHYDPSDPRWEDIRVNLGYARRYADRMNLVAMKPLWFLASTYWCLATETAQQSEYLVYAPDQGGPYEVQVNLRDAVGTLTVEWFDPATGLTIDGGTTTGGDVRFFTTPTAGDAVLYIHH